MKAPRKPTTEATAKVTPQPPPADEAFRLAQLAAPFAAAGLADEDALQRAAELLKKASAFVAREKDDAFQAAGRSAFTTTLEGVRHLLGAKDNRTVKTLLLKVLGREAGLDLWNRAIAGDHVFTPELWGPMKSAKPRAGARNSIWSRARSESFEKNCLTSPRLIHER